jgi:hypothetical protein
MVQKRRSRYVIAGAGIKTALNLSVVFSSSVGFD